MAVSQKPKLIRLFFMIPVGVAHVRESGLRNSEKFGCGIPNLGLWNSEYSSRNLESQQCLESRIQVLLTKIGIKHLESGI